MAGVLRVVPIAPPGKEYNSTGKEQRKEIFRVENSYLKET